MSAARLGALLDAWNEATAPYTPRTDEEHAECRIIAAGADRELRLKYRGMWRETENGFRMVARVSPWEAGQ